MEMNKEIVYHFIGIKGAGMSSLALVLNKKGLKVQGSDVDKELFTQIILEQESIKILSFNINNIQKDMIVIVSNYFQDKHIEIERAQELGCKVIYYHKFLGDFIKQEKFKSIAITGSHGKTSTTGLMGHLLSGVSPTSYLIGNGTGFYENNSKYFVFEACEYKRHFLAYEPDYAIMTNIDFDHPDYYLDINDVFQAFQSLTHNVKKGIIAYGDDQYLCKLDNNNNNINIYYYGIGSENDFQARNIQLDANGSKFDVYCFNKFFGHFQLAIFGFHNILNHLAVISFAFLENIGFNQIINQLNTFKGVTRRFNEKTINNIKIIDDYAHHPTEIKATLLSIRQKYPTLNIISIFQPHTFSRTKTFLNEFANSLDFSNKVYLCDIFGSREYNKSTDGGIIIDELMLKIKTHAGASILTLDNIDILFDNNDNRDCVFVFMGAGDIQKFQKAFEQLCIKRVN